MAALVEVLLHCGSNWGADELKSVIKKMVRPERLELPAFWFVAR